MMEAYNQWADLPPDTHTKTQWAKLGYKLRTDAEPCGEIQGKYDTYRLYNKSSVLRKRTTTSRPAKIGPLTPENIARCLYIINKAAKRRRDAASASYYANAHSFAGAHSVQKKRYYVLKDAALDRAILLGWAACIGHHRQNGIPRREKKYHPDGCQCEWCIDCEIGDRYEPGFDWVEVTKPVYLLCYEMAGYHFHRITENEIPLGTNIENLGDWLSQAVAHKGNVRIKDAIATLKQFTKTDEPPARA